LVESERRLFSVALTRARKGVYVFATKNAKQKVSRFIHEAFIPETVAAVDSVAGIMERGTATEADRRALTDAARQFELRGGLVYILRDAMQAAPGCRQAVQSLLPGLLSVPLTPFCYPEAYPDTTEAQPTRRGGVGLPF
jgi:hypothetical protein